MLKSVLKYILQWSRRLIVRVVLYAAMAFGAVIAAILIGPYVPQSVIDYMGLDALETVLTTLASSMLAVTTFSLSILSSAYRSSESTATPRAVLVLREDETTHKILAVFIGAFLFSLTTIVLMATPLMREATRIVLFAVTVFVVLQVLIAIIRWIHHIEQLGSLENTLTWVQSRVRPVMKSYHPHRALDTHPMTEDERDFYCAGLPIHARRDGYVQQIFVDALQEEAEKCDAQIRITVQPGEYVTCGAQLLTMTGPDSISAAQRKVMCEAFLIHPNRSFYQDPEFGISVMTEVATRALSPGINDPQTAVDVVNRLSALLQHACPKDMDEVDQAKQEKPPENDRLWCVPVPIERLYTCSFDVIARYSDDIPELRAALTRSLKRLNEACDEDGAKAARQCAIRIGCEL